MGFRFRTSVGLVSGVWLNISKHGLSSVSVGRRGAVVNIGRRGVRETIGLPGTGLSYTTDRHSGLIATIISTIVAAIGVLFTLAEGLFGWVLRP